MKDGARECEVEGLFYRAGSGEGVFISLFILVGRAILGPSDLLLGRE